MSLTADSSVILADSSIGTADGYYPAGGQAAPASVVTGGGGGKGGRVPPYWWQAQYKELREIPLPVDEEANEEAREVLARLQALWRDLDEREVKFQRMMAEVDRLIARVAVYIESRKLAQLLEETKQRIQAAEDARRARIAAEDREIEELMVIL